MPDTLTPDVLTLCAVLDDGDDSALLPLADALEEAGRPIPRDRHPGACLTSYGHVCRWMPPLGEAWYDRESPERLSLATFRRLRRAGQGVRYRRRVATYPTRSAALLALALALVEDSARTPSPAGE